jgi:predicted phosphodiesterase
MRIAVLTDAHGNLPALRAALAEIRRIGVDAVHHTGDAIGIGPQPAETLDLLLSQPDAVLLMGNHDEWFAKGLAERPEWMSAGELTHHRWVHAQLDPALRAVVADWPYALDGEIGGARVRFLHYPLTPHGFAHFRTLETPADADALFGGAGDADVVFYGHHHPFSDLSGAARYVNPGSLGCHHRPLARFAVLEAAGDGHASIAFHAAPYDPAPMLAEFERRGVPERDFILRHFMPQP